MSDIVQALQDNSTLSIILAVAASTATIVWKVAQYANRMMATIQQQKYTTDSHTEQLKEHKQHIADVWKIQGIHHTRLTKLEAK